MSNETTSAVKRSIVPAKVSIFEIGERLLCFHGEVLYDAKCLDVDNTDKKDPKYYIHYVGWNKHHDAWKDSSTLLKRNDENLKMKAEMDKAIEGQKKTSKNKKIWNWCTYRTTIDFVNCRYIIDW